MISWAYSWISSSILRWLKPSMVLSLVIWVTLSRWEYIVQQTFCSYKRIIGTNRWNTWDKDLPWFVKSRKRVENVIFPWCQSRTIWLKWFRNYSQVLNMNSKLPPTYKTNKSITCEMCMNDAGSYLQVYAGDQTMPKDR